MESANNQSERSAETNDYLWNGSGKPDPEIQKLETMLGKFQHARRVLESSLIVPKPSWRWFPRRVQQLALVMGIATAVAITTLLFVVYRSKPTPSTTVAGWDVSRVSGSPHVGQAAVSGKEIRRLQIGQRVETDPQSRASLRAESIGQIEVEPSTRVRLLMMAAGLKRIALDRGTIHAYIWAPPGQFVVDTPSAVTVDLGCAYTLQVDDAGAGLVRTSLGWVGFKLNGHESFIPAGAACATRPKVGPGTPYFEDASARFRAALEQFDFKDNTPQQRAADLAIILAESRKRDALTLWHLLSRADNEMRVAVYERLRAFVQPPSGVTKEEVLRLNQVMLDRWWNELGFDDISVWRHWERSWSGNVAPQQK